MALLYLKIFIAFSYISCNRGAASENRTTTAAGTDRDATDGELFVKRIVHGEKISEQPGYLLFTAPYRLCAGGCTERNNFAMVFPLFVGQKGKSFYQSMYQRDYSTANNNNAPFKPLRTRLPYTTCSTSKNMTNECHNSTTEQVTPELTPSDITSSTVPVQDTRFNTFVKLDCPKLAQCRHAKHNLGTKSLLQNFRTRFTSPRYPMRFRLTSNTQLRQRTKYMSRNKNNLVIRPQRDIFRWRKSIK